MKKTKKLTIKIKKEELMTRPRSEILDTRKHRDKSKYRRKGKHPKKGQD